MFLLGVIITFCTLTSAYAAPRVVGGQNAANGQFPYMVSIKYGKSHVCGGSIIDETTILTAAHCQVNYPYTLQEVAVGTNSIAVGSGTLYRIEKIITHPGYNSTGYVDNDIAVLKVTPPIEFDDIVKPVLLPTHETPGSTEVTLTGWGATIAGGQAPIILQWVDLYTLDTSACKSYWVIFDTQVCTLTKVGEGTCNGDSGGPLVNKQGEQVGIVSTGWPCAIGMPDIFTNVYAYLDWIAENSV